MSDENQAAPPPDPGAAAPDGGAGGSAPVAPSPHAHPVFAYLEPPPRPPGALEPAASPFAPRTVVHGAFALALLGLAALLVGQMEASFLIALAALCSVAQGADAHPSLRRLDVFLAWLPPVAGAFLLGGLARMLLHQGPPAPARLGFAVFAGLGALASLATLLPPVADRLVRLLFRGSAPSHTLRLSARIALVALWLGLPAWVGLRDQLTDMLKDPAAVVSPSHLSGGLVGYVVLAVVAVGYRVRRDGRATLARLGLGWPRPADWLAVAAGVAALWLFNAASELLERSAFPALWAADQGFTSALAGVMGPGRMLLLGLSAGVGEEITLRGALQPKLGIGLTSVLFAVLHVQYSWFGMLSILVFGLILGAIRQRHGTTAAILVHALYDLLAVATARG